MSVMALAPEAVAEAARRLAPYVRRTPLFATDALGPLLAVKAEHLQHTGSFKFRGAMNRLLALDEAGRSEGVVTASTGNHGIGVATAGGRLGVPVTVFVASGVESAITDRLTALGAEVRRIDSEDCADAEREARRVAGVEGRAFVSPYNDPIVAAGQGTIGMEVLEQLGEMPEVSWDGLDAVIVAVGGGGLISGIATWVTHAAPGTRVIGAQPAVDAAMTASVAAGRIVDVEAKPTLSHSTAGGIEDEAITFELCRDLVADWMLVDEDAIAGAVRSMMFGANQLVEGAAGVALAAGAELARREPDARIAVISCGARLTPAELDAVLAA
jgi:threonine dehydratase